MGLALQSGTPGTAKGASLGLRPAFRGGTGKEHPASPAPCWLPHRVPEGIRREVWAGTAAIGAPVPQRLAPVFPLCPASCPQRLWLPATLLQPCGSPCGTPEGLSPPHLANWPWQGSSRQAGGSHSNLDPKGGAVAFLPLFCPKGAGGQWASCPLGEEKPLGGNSTLHPRAERFGEGRGKRKARARSGPG